MIVNGTTSTDRPHHSTAAGVRSPVLEVQGGSKHYGGVWTLRDVSFGVGESERLGIIGPNGAGKSTLFRVIAGEEPIDDGRVTLYGDDVTRASAESRARRGLGRTFQITNVFSTLLVRDNLALAARAPTRQRRAVEEDQIIADLGLDRLLDTRPEELSYGDQRLVELAITLFSGASLLLLDEPAAGLGHGERDRLRGVLKGLPEDLTVVLIEHDLPLVLDVAERVICLAAGQVIADGPPADVRADPEVARVYLGSTSGTEDT
ncbi:ABC transporter ATP-binding protein [Phytoactinopolyspora limicola]|uniref:ABC transporter ATP-binding protein n=1 Tax=Phytoactinopolyspora limicola TaxID=2715536 RepID=UPI00140B045E|nr:ABC transporter ATP-binding protein [Phytoactinopolyspora limicola]